MNSHPARAESRDEETHATLWERLLGISSATSSPACIHRALVGTSYGRRHGCRYWPRGSMKDIAGWRRLEKSVTVIATHQRSPLRSLPSEDHHGASRSCQAAHHSAKCACQALLGYWSAPLICVRCSDVAAVLGAYVGSAKLS